MGSIPTVASRKWRSVWQSQILLRRTKLLYMGFPQSGIRLCLTSPDAVSNLLYNTLMAKKEIIKKAILLFLLITSISVGLIYIQNQIGLERIREIIIHAGFWGPLVYILLDLLTHIVAPIQGTPIMLIAFAVFGKWAVIYTYIVVVISSFTNFWIARKLGRSFVVKLIGKEGMSKIDHIATHEGTKALIIMRFFQGWISDFVSYASGLTSIKFPVYYLISVLVPIPWTLAMFFFFNYIPQQQILFWVMLVGGIFFIIPPLYYFLRHRFYRKRVVHKKIDIKL